MFVLTERDNDRRVVGGDIAFEDLGSCARVAAFDKHIVLERERNAGHQSRSAVLEALIRDLGLLEHVAVHFEVRVDVRVLLGNDGEVCGGKIDGGILAASHRVVSLLYGESVKFDGHKIRGSSLL